MHEYIESRGWEVPSEPWLVAPLPDGPNGNAVFLLDVNEVKPVVESSTPEGNI